MKNKIYYINSQDVTKLKKGIKNEDSIFIAEIDESLIDSKEDYLQIASEIFKFPYPSKGFDGYYDWMTDLSWLNKSGYVLIISNYNKFIRHNDELKNNIINGFEEGILPFWEDDVEKVVAGGSPKPFNLYLVTNEDVSTVIL